MAIAGLAVGSFLNVVAHRLPRGESLLRPRSRCPSCGVQIAVYDNVPVISWIVLRGRCRHCGTRISVRYPLVEAATAALFLACLFQQGTDAELLPALALMATLVAVTATDLEHRIVPNKVMVVSALAAVVLWAIADPSQLLDNLLAAAIAGGSLLLVSELFRLLLGRDALGMGDVKLAAVMGLYLGSAVAPALFVGFAAGAVAGIAAARIAGARGPDARRYAIPFAPFMALGGVVGQFWGPQLVDWYLRVSGLS